MFTKVLIANRGEIAVRVARSCRELDVATVGLYSDVDAGARHVAMMDEAVHLPGVAPADTYLRTDAVVRAAIDAGAEAIHPGYGFLSERAEAARAVLDAGLVWIGPSPDVIDAVGDKLRARALAEEAGVPVVPGTREPARGTEEVRAFADVHGYPVAIKAAAGGGGRGFRVARSADDAEAAYEGAVREAEAYFGRGEVYLERYLAAPKHVEVQILSARPGGAVWLGARDCSLQRRHQKLVEETPPPRAGDLVPEMGDAAVRLANACGYTNAGTVEFLVDPDGSFAFLEVNARLQVEHTITEAVTGLDLVACQLRIAADEPFPLSQEDLGPGGRYEPRGHAIECRINAEDPARGFVPSPGRIGRYEEPGGPGVRVDGGFRSGDEIPPAYDSLIAKLVAWAPDRDEARRRMLRALEEFRIEGPRTTIPAHLHLLAHPAFVDGSYTTRTVEDGALDGLVPDAGDGEPPLPGRGATLSVGGVPVELWNRAIAGSIAGRAGATGGPTGAILAPMHGTIIAVLVGDGDRVEAGDGVAVLEAMKMETVVAAPGSGTVRSIEVRPGDVVETGQAIGVVG